MRLADLYGLDEEDLQVNLPSGLHSMFSSRVDWAIHQLSSAELLARVGVA